MVRELFSTPPSSTPSVQEYNPHTKIYLPSSERELPVEVQGYNTATKVALGILGGLVFLYFVGLIHRIVTDLDSQCNSEADKCCNIGRQHFKDNKVADAKKMFEKALGWSPSNPAIQAKAYLGVGLICGDNQKAIGYFTQAIELGLERTNLSLAYIKRAACYEAVGSYKLALQDLVKALPFSEPDNKGSILFGMSAIYSRANRLPEAFRKCMEAVKEAKNPEDAIKYLNFALQLMGATRNDQYADLLRQKASCFFQQNKYQEAVKDLTAALGCEIKSDYLKARLTHNRGMTYLKLGLYGLALNDFEAADKYQYIDIENLGLKKSNLDAIKKLREGLAQMGGSTQDEKDSPSQVPMTEEKLEALLTITLDSLDSSSY